MLLGITAMSIFVGSPVANALPDPSFRVQCYVTGQRMDDPIVFPGQAGKSHMHTFYGATVVHI